MSKSRRGATGLIGSVKMKLKAALLAVACGCNVRSSVADIYTALDAEGNRRRNTFFTDSNAVICIAEVSSGRVDETIEMYIRQLKDDKGANVDKVMAYSEGPSLRSDTPTIYTARLLAISPTGEASSDLPVPAGAFQCEVRVDGSKQMETTFVVKYPECPQVAIVPGATCQGTYAPGKVCPLNGLSSRDQMTTCSCQDGKWSC
jgi:hypothetical protein